MLPHLVVCCYMHVLLCATRPCCIRHLLNLLELMDAEDAKRVAPVRARLFSETRRVPAIMDRQLLRRLRAHPSDELNSNIARCGPSVDVRIHVSTCAHSAARGAILSLRMCTWLSSSVRRGVPSTRPRGSTRSAAPTSQ